MLWKKSVSADQTRQEREALAGLEIEIGELSA